MYWVGYYMAIDNDIFHILCIYYYRCYVGALFHVKQSYWQLPCSFIKDLLCIMFHMKHYD